MNKINNNCILLLVDLFLNPFSYIWSLEFINYWGLHEVNFKTFLKEFQNKKFPKKTFYFYFGDLQMNNLIFKLMNNFIIKNIKF